MTKLLKASVAFLGILALSACGGGGAKTPPIADASLGGIWTGTVTIEGQGAIGLFALTTETGEAQFIQEDGVQYWGTVDSSQRNLTGTLTAATRVGATFPDGSAGGTGSLVGTILPYGRIGGTVSLTTTGGATVSGQVALDFDPDYGRGSSFVFIEGTYTDATDPGSDALTIDSTGVLFAQVPSTSCVLNGQVLRTNLPNNTYSVSVTYSNCTGDDSILNGSTLNGLGAVGFNPGPETFTAGLHGTTGSGRPVAVFLVYRRT